MTLLDMLPEFGRSDVGGHPVAAWHVWLSNSVAHAGIGAFAALAGWRRRAVLVAVLWIGKEVTCDLPADGFALLTLADSAADLALAALGWWWALYSMDRKADLPRRH